MNYKMPFIVSLVLSATGAALLYLGHTVSGQTSLVFAFLLSIAAFKVWAGRLTATGSLLPALLLAWFYFTPQQLPFLSVAIILAGIQNPFLETFAPHKMYNSPYFKMIVGLISMAFFFTGNIVYADSWQAWVFPGIVLFLANFLTAIITLDIIKLGQITTSGYIKNGSACPDFNLPDEKGANVTLGDFAGKYLLMIFVRGDWCPGCHIMLRTYQRNKEKFAERNVHLLSIGPDPLGVNKEMVEKLGLTYNVLSDEKQMLARQFCVELQPTNAGVPSNYEFVPLPASFLIDKEGIVRYTSRADKAGEILNPSQVFDVLDSLG